MLWTFFYYNDNVPMCPSESNLDYNPTIQLDVKNYSKYKTYFCEKRLKWFEINDQNDLTNILWSVPSIRRYHSQEDIDRLIDSYCLSMYSQYVPCQRVVSFNLNQIQELQNELYQKAIYKKMINFDFTQYETALWYMNTFWYVPFLSRKYIKRVEELRALKEQMDVDSIKHAKYILDQFKNIVAQIQTESHEDSLILLWV